MGVRKYVEENWMVVDEVWKGKGRGRGKGRARALNGDALIGVSIPRNTVEIRIPGGMWMLVFLFFSLHIDFSI